MRQLPQPPRIEKETDLPTILTEYLRQLDSWLKALPQYEEKVVTFVGGTPLDVECSFQPTNVLIGWILGIDGSAVGAEHSITWYPAPRGFSITAIDGLTSGTSYTVRLVMMRGPQ